MGNGISVAIVGGGIGGLAAALSLWSSSAREANDR